MGTVRRELKDHNHFDKMGRTATISTDLYERAAADSERRDYES